MSVSGESTPRLETIFIFTCASPKYLSRTPRLVGSQSKSGSQRGGVRGILVNTEFFLLPLYLRLDNLTPGMLRIECQELGKIPLCTLLAWRPGNQRIK